MGISGQPSGGRLLATGWPEEIAAVEASHTGRFLQRMLAGGSRYEDGQLDAALAELPSLVHASVDRLGTDHPAAQRAIELAVCVSVSLAAGREDGAERFGALLPDAARFGSRRSRPQISDRAEPVTLPPQRGAGAVSS